MDAKNWGPTTAAIHAGRMHNPTRAAITPIFQTTLFRIEDFDEGAALAKAIEPPSFYTRMGNPNALELETVLATLERAERALVTSSGMAAIAIVFETFLRPGDRLVAPRAIYSGTEQLLKHWESSKGLHITWIENSLDLNAWEEALRQKPAMVWVESPSNPTLAITDLAAVAALAQTWGVRSVADNTFATPAFTRPLELGFDLSVSSATKYLAGHSDVVAGLIAGREKDIVACWSTAKLIGPILDPFAAWLLHRGLKTFHLRVRRATDSAQTLAQWLLWHPQITHVNYPGLPEHPGHAIAAKQMADNFGAMLSFELLGGIDAGRHFCQALDIITPGISLGGVESLIQHPASTSHGGASAEIKRQLGISDGLLRLSIGIEDCADLKRDLERGLQAAALMRS